MNNKFKISLVNNNSIKYSNKPKYLIDTNKIILVKLINVEDLIKKMNLVLN